MATSFPVEIWLAIAEHVRTISDLASLGQTSTQLHCIANPLLYKRAAESYSGLRAIFWGVRYGLAQTVRNALTAGVDPNIVWHSKEDVILKEKLVPTFDECLVSYKSEITRNDDMWDHRPRYWSPLHIAAFLDDLEMLKLLLECGARLMIGSFGACPCYNLHDNARRVRSSYIYFPWARFPSWTPYHVAICTGSRSITEYFMAGTADHEMECFEWYIDRFPTGVTPLHMASLTGNEEMLRMLLERSSISDVEALDARGATPLVFACYHGNWNCASELLRHGADINRICTRIDQHHHGHIENISTTILGDTLESCKYEDCVRLLELGADPVVSEGAREDRLPMIHQLCTGPWHHGHWEYDGFTAGRVRRPPQTKSAEALLDRFIADGLDFSLSVRERNDEFGSLYNTPLCFAASCANIPAAKRLIAAGADVNGVPEQDVMTPMTRACALYNGNAAAQMVKLLLDSGASVNRLRNGTKAPLWALWEDCNINSTQNELRQKLTDLLLEHGSNPGRGTSIGDIDHATALDSQLYEQDFDGFQDLRSRHPGPLGDDDFLGFWDVAVRTEEPEVVRYVIEDDSDGVIARKCPTALAYLLTELPHETNLILRLLEKGADPNSACAHVTPLVYVMNHATWPIPRKMFLLKALLEAKASIHHRLEPAAPGHIQFSEYFMNPLYLAIDGLDRTAKFMEMMLSIQPLRDNPEIDPSHYITQACDVGNFRALFAIIKSSEAAHTVLRESSSILVHRLLDGVPQKATMREVNATIDCLQLLIQNGADLSASATPETLNGTLAEQKIRAYMSLDNSLQCTQKDRALAWCCRQKMDFPEDADMPLFKPETTAFFFQLHMALENLGKILEDDSRRYDIVWVGK